MLDFGCPPQCRLFSEALAVSEKGLVGLGTAPITVIRSAAVGANDWTSEHQKNLRRTSNFKTYNLPHITHTIFDCNLQHHTTNVMGNDGGSIPTRRELVKNAARNPNSSELKATQHEAQTHAWEQCPLSNRLLVPPIVSDCAGTLYNKDAILEQLLPKDDDVPASVIKEKEEVLQGRVKGLRDIVEVKFTILKEGREEKRICPVTSKELGPNTKSVYLVPCGHAFSEVAIRELAGDACVECNEPYTPDNIIPILSLAKEDLERLVARANKLKEAGLTHSLKKAPGSKKRKKNAEEVPVEGKVASINGVSKDALTENTKSNGAIQSSKNGTSVPASSGIKNAATASLTAKVLEEQDERNKRRKLGLNDNLKTLFSSAGYSAQTHKGGDFMTRGYSIPKKN